MFGTELIRTTFVAFMLAAVSATLTGCNTIAGAGQDIERGGQVIRDAAKDVQRKM